MEVMEIKKLRWFVSMLNFIYRLLGWRCCGEWTPWDDRQANFERPVDILLDSVCAATMNDKVVFTIRWQERKCSVCGKIQQRRLDQ